MNLIGYIRVSTEEQARDGVSLGQQLDRLRAYCQLHGHALVAVATDEGVSASVALARRAGGRQVLDALKGGMTQGVVVIRLDRLFRDALDGLTFFAQADRHGATVHSVSELIDTGTPAGRLALTIQLAAAQYERDLAVLRAKECNTALRRKGRVYGHVPFGCKAVGEGDDRRLLRDPETWPIREGIVRALDGDASLRGVARDLELSDVPSPTGKRHWSPNTLRELRTHHADLASLPLYGEHDATAAACTPEAEVSSDA